MKNKLYIFFLIIFYCLAFSDPIENYLKIGGMQEIYSFVLFALALIFFTKNTNLSIKKYDLKILIITITFLFIGFLGNVKSGYQNNIYAIVSALLTTRFIFAYFATGLIFKSLNLYNHREEFNKQIKKIIKFIVMLAVIFQLFNINTTYESFYGINITKIIFSHPTILNSFCVLLITFLTFFLKSNKENKKYIVILLILMSITLKSKALIFVGVYILFMIYFYYRNKSKNKWWLSRSILIFIFIPICSICIKVFYDKYFLFKVTYGDTARNVLLETSKILVKDYFPIGTGFGTFASAISGQYYSKLYFDYGISNTYGMTPDKYSFISDSFWPMILGENGAIGFVLFILIILMFIAIIRKYRNKVLNVNYYAAYIPILYLLISSLGESSFAHPVAVGFFLAYGVIVSTLNNMLKVE